MAAHDLIPSIPLQPVSKARTCGIYTRRGMGRRASLSCRPIGGETPPRLLDRPMRAPSDASKGTRSLWSRFDTPGPQNPTDAARGLLWDVLSGTRSAGALRSDDKPIVSLRFRRGWRSPSPAGSVFLEKWGFDSRQLIPHTPSTRRKLAHA